MNKWMNVCGYVVKEEKGRKESGAKSASVDQWSLYVWLVGE